MNRRGKKRIIWLVTAVLGLLALPKEVQAQQVAIHTDVMQDALMIPNVGVEFFIDDTKSVQFSGFATTSPWTLDMKAVGVQAAYKYWLSGRPLTREFVGINSVFSTYRVTTGEKIRKGDVAGLGVCFGYAWPLTKRLSLTAHSSLGLAYYRQKEYFSYDDISNYIENQKMPNSTGLRLVPLNIGVTISYIIK